MVYFGGFFPKLEYSRSFLYISLIYIPGRISAAVMAGDIIFFCLAGPVGYYTGNILNQSLGAAVERYTFGTGNPSSSLKRSILFLEISRVQHSSEGRSLSRGCDVAQLNEA